MVKAKIENIRVSGDASKYIVSVRYPEFPAPGGTTEMLVFETTAAEYSAWTPPGGMEKNPSNFLREVYIKPGYNKLENVHNQFHNLIGTEYDWP